MGNVSACVIELCESLSLKYDIHLLPASTGEAGTRIKRRNQTFEVKLRLYSPALKKQIGDMVRLSFQQSGSEKLIDEFAGEYILTREGLSICAARLFLKNLNLNVTQTKLHGKKKVDLYSNAVVVKVDRKKKTSENRSGEEQIPFAVYWLSRFRDIKACDTKSSRTDADFQKTFADVLRGISDFDLAGFNTPDSSLQEAHAVEFCNRIHSGLGLEDSVMNENVQEHAKVLSFAVDRYLQDKRIDPDRILSVIRRHSNPSVSSRSKVRKSMKQRCLPVEAYRQIYTALREKKGPYALPLMLMVFLGMTAEEVCGLQKGDVQPITNYLGNYQLQVVRICRKVGERYKYIEYTDDSDDFRYRFIPFPKALWSGLLDLPLNLTDKKELTKPLFKADNMPMRPQRLEEQLRKLGKDLKTSDKELTHLNEKGVLSQLDMSFAIEDYRFSCRHYWQYSCGLSDGEIRYLAGLTPQDTASEHYIDYDNQNVQFRMLMQLQYGMAFYSNKGTSSKPLYDWKDASEVFTVRGGLKEVVLLQLKIMKPIEFTLESNRGIQIYLDTRGGNDVGKITEA